MAHELLTSAGRGEKPETAEVAKHLQQACEERLVRAFGADIALLGSCRDRCKSRPQRQAMADCSSDAASSGNGVTSG